MVTRWHGEGTSRDTSLLFLALILGFSDSVARRVSCILLFMPVNAPAETFPATVLYSLTVFLLFCESKNKKM